MRIDDARVSVIALTREHPLHRVKLYIYIYIYIYIYEDSYHLFARIE